MWMIIDLVSQGYLLVGRLLAKVIMMMVNMMMIIRTILIMMRQKVLVFLLVCGLLAKALAGSDHRRGCGVTYRLSSQRATLTELSDHFKKDKGSDQLDTNMLKTKNKEQRTTH